MSISNLYKLNKTEDTESHNALFIICPFCQIEYFLRAKFGEDILFVTVPGGVLNVHTQEILGMREFIKREQITDVYLVNNISCNFIEEAIAGDKEFGLHCEKQFRELSKKLSGDFENLSLKEKKKLLAKSNVLTQLECLKSRSLFKDETSQININVHGIITDKNNEFQIIN